MVCSQDVLFFLYHVGSQSNRCFLPQSTGILTSSKLIKITLAKEWPETCFSCDYTSHHINNWDLSITSTSLVYMKQKYTLKTSFKFILYVCANIYIYVFGPKNGGQRTIFRGNSFFLLWIQIWLWVLLAIKFLFKDIMITRYITLNHNFSFNPNIYHLIHKLESNLNGPQST